MTGKTDTTTRRSVLQTIAGATLATFGAGKVTAQADHDRSPHQNSRDSINSEWIIQLTEPNEWTADDPSQSAIKDSINDLQRPVISSVADHEHAQIERRYWLTNAVLISADEGEIDPQKEFGQLENVESVHANFEIEPPEPVSKSLLNKQQNHRGSTYGLNQVNAREVWEEFGTRGSGVRVAVLDTGVDPSHPAIELASDGWAQFDAQGNQVNTQPNDPDGHGTHVSGTATGGFGDAVNRYIGVAPDAELYHAKVLSDGGTFAQIVAGMQWAVENDSDIVNMSLGAPGYFPEFVPAVRNSLALGTLVVASSGNAGEGVSGSPGNIQDTFGVGATDIQRNVAGFSSGEQVYTPEAWGDAAPEDWPDFYTVPDVSAPGVDVLSAVPGGGYAAFNGTSMASPHAAGCAALLLSADQSQSPQQLASNIRSNSVHEEGSDRGIRYGNGIVDALRSVTDRETEGTITGSVTGPDGTPATGVEVVSSYGTRDVTGEEGGYRLPHPEGDASVIAQGFGVEGATTATVSGRTSEDITLQRVVEAELRSDQRPDIAAGDSFQIELVVANLEELTVELTQTSGGIEPGDLTVSVGSRTFQPGDTISFSNAISGPVSLEVQVADSAPDGAAFGLNHTLAGPGEDVSVTTPVEGTTTVIQDPTAPTFEITQPNFDGTVGANRVLETMPKVANTGDLTATQVVELELEIAGVSGTFEYPATLSGGESTQIDMSITFGGGFPRTEGTQTIRTEDDSATGTFFYQDSAHRVRSVDGPETVTAGDDLTLTVGVENIGELDLSQSIFIVLGGNLVAQENVSVSPGTSSDIEVTIGTEGIIPKEYTYGVIDPDRNQLTGRVTVEEPEAPVINGNRVTDPDDDGRYEDLNGNGRMDVADVQAFFANIDSSEVQQNSQLFDFNDSGQVNVADVQALFDEVSGS